MSSLRIKRVICIMLVICMILTTMAGCSSSSEVIEQTQEPVSTETIPAATENRQPSESPVETEPVVEPTDEPDPEMAPEEVADPDNTAVSMTEEQRNSINMLNYLTVLMQEIYSSKNSRMYLESAYSELFNNTEPNMINDDTLAEYENLMDIIENYRMISVKRERLQYIYDQNSANALREALPNPMSVFNVVGSGSLLKAIVSVAYLALDSKTSYESYTSALDLQYLQDGWELDDEEAAVLHESHKDMLAYMVHMSQDLPSGVTLNEEAIKDFVEWKNEDNLSRKIRWLESNQNTYKAYGEYWLTLAQAYFENGAYKDCLSAISAYEQLNIKMFRNDFQLAQVLPCAIYAAREVMSEDGYVEYADKCVGMILGNTQNSDWSLRYFAAQIYLDLFAKTNDADYMQKAYEIALDNVNEMVDDQQKLNETFLADLALLSTDNITATDKDKIKAEKKEIKNYNKMLEEDRQTELPPVYEPLRLNCDLLFALAKELNISDAAKKQIDGILHPNGERIFLNKAIDNSYRFSAGKYAFNVDKIDVQFDGDTLSIPAAYVSDSSVITVVVKNGKTTETISDWKIDEVDRNDSQKVKDFTAIFHSEAAEDIDYKDGAAVTVTVEPVGDNDTEVSPLTFTFKASAKKVLWAFSSMDFTRVIK